MRRAVLLLALVGLCGCTDPDRAQRALQGLGFTAITITGWRPFMCSEDDWFKTGFTAVSLNGEMVSGAVCSSWWKGATVRFD